MITKNKWHHCQRQSKFSRHIKIIKNL